MIIVTSGYRFLDIDAYGGCVAYAELLRLQGHAAQAVSTAPMNESIPGSVRAWPAELVTTYQPGPDDTFVLVDLSDPAYVDRFVKTEAVCEVIDHHLGNEDAWRHLDDKAQIEFIGAACTLVAERWIAAGLVDTISKTSARLLIAGILDNTLNLKAQITTDRDRAAYQQLLVHADLPNDWSEAYFRECTQSITDHLEQALMNDYKPVKYLSYPEELAVGQLAVWDAQELLADKRAALDVWFGQLGLPWFMNLISVSDGTSTFVCTSPEIRSWLSALLGVTFDSDTAHAPRSWLRKEIFKRDSEYAS